MGRFTCGLSNSQTSQTHTFGSVISIVNGARIHLESPSSAAHKIYLLPELQLFHLLVLTRVVDCGRAISHLYIGISMFNEVLSPLFIFLLEPVFTLVLHKEVGESDSKSTTACCDDEGVFLSEVVCGTLATLR